MECPDIPACVGQASGQMLCNDMVVAIQKRENMEYINRVDVKYYKI
jgi:hypothetical protein